MERLPAGWRSIDEAPEETEDEAPDPAGDTEVITGAAGAAPASMAGAAAPSVVARRRAMFGVAGLVGLALAAALAILSSAAPQPVVLIGDQPAGRFLEVDGGPAASPGSSAIARSPAATSAAEVAVDVAGAVARPGVYRLPAGSRVGDALREAGGFSAAVDVLAVEREINLAAALADGEKIRVPALGDIGSVPGVTPDAGEPASSSSAGGRVDLNRASVVELDALPGVGPVTAAKIVAAREERPFTTVDELDERGVVGPSVLEKFRELVTVGP